MKWNITRLIARNKTVGVLTLLIVLACMFAIYLRLFTQKELWYEMFAAVIGVIITAIITMVLLNGQSDNDAKREQNAKVFEEKLRVYQEFLQTLNNVIEDGVLTDEEKLKLEFQTSYVAMHCKPCYIVTVSKAVEEVIALKCKEQDKGVGQGDNADKVLANLFKIVGAFRADLYEPRKEEDNIIDENDPNLRTTLNIFSNAYREAKGEETPKVEIPAAPALQENGGQRIWDNQTVKIWGDEGWTVEEYPEKDQMVLRKKGIPAHIGIWFGGKDGEHYYIGAGFEGKAEDADFVLPLKWDCGGRKSRGWWLKVFPSEFNSMPRKSLYTALQEDRDLEKYIVNSVNMLRDVLERHFCTMGLKKSVLGNRKDWNGWRVYIWYWDTLRCEWDNKEAGKPYLNIAKENGHFTISVFNRDCDYEKLKALASRLLGRDIREIIGDSVVLETLEMPISKDDIARRVVYWVDKMAQ